MSRLVTAEWIKFRSTLLPYVLIVCGIALTLLNVVALTLASGQPGVPPVSDPVTVRNIFGSAAQTSLIALVLGILAMTGEFRSQTITATYLAEPHRGRVLAAKMLLNAAVGFMLGVINAVVVLLVAIPLLAWRDAVALPASDVAGILLAVPPAYAMYAILGVAFGTLVRNQVVALVIALLWVMLVEALIVAFLTEVGKWLPGGALSGMLGSSGYGGSTYLHPLAAAFVLAAWAALFSAVAAMTTLRRDIT